MDTSTPDPGEVTRLLDAWAGGDHAAFDGLFPLLYPQLKRIAGSHLRSERQGHTLQPTALVHEAWLKMVGSEGNFTNRQHFLGVASKAMRSVLVDHVRRKRAEKRGGQAQQTSLDDTVAFLEAGEVDLLDLDAALAELERDDPDLARCVELRFFSGMTNAEIAAFERCSESTIERAWRLARARLHRRLSGEEGT